MGSSLAIVLFVMAINIGLFALPVFKKKYTNSEITNLVIRRSFITVGLYLIGLNAAIVATIASNAGLELTREMFFYMVMFGWAGYVAMIVLIVKTIFDTLSLYKLEKRKKETGIEDE